MSRTCVVLMRNKKHPSAVSKQARTKNNTIVRFRVRFSFFCSEPQKREKATVDHKRRSHRHHHRTLSLSLAAHDTQTQTRTKGRNQNHIVQSLLHVKLRVKETKRVRARPLLLLFASFQTTKRANLMRLLFFERL